MIEPNLIMVKPLDDYILYLKYENGEERIFDVKPYIEGDWYGELANKFMFSSVQLSGLSIEWSGGQDIAPDDLYELSIPFSEYKNTNYQ